MVKIVNDTGKKIFAVNLHDSFIIPDLHLPCKQSLKNIKMKKLVMFLSIALILGVVTANAQDKKKEVKKAPAKTEVAKPAAKAAAPAAAAPAAKPAAKAAKKAAKPADKK